MSDRFELWSYQILAKLFGQSAKDGARPLVYAATSNVVEAGKYYGPTGLFEMNGDPGPATPCRCVWNTSIARRLWQVSEQLTGVHYQL